MAHKGHAFSVEIYCCSVEIDLLRALPAVPRANLSLLRAKSFAPYKPTMLLRTKIELLRGKFDVSQYKSKVSPCKIRCFSVQIESDRNLLRGKLHSELGDLGSPRPANKSLKLCFGGGKLCCCKDILSLVSKWSRPAFIAANIFKKMLNFAPTVGRSSQQ